MSLRSCLSGGLETVGKAGKALARKKLYIFPWEQKLDKVKHELKKGRWGYWYSGRWNPAPMNAYVRAELRKTVLKCGFDWPFDPETKEKPRKSKGRFSKKIMEREDRKAHIQSQMEKMPEILLDYKKRKWEFRMKKEEKRRRWWF